MTYELPTLKCKRCGHEWIPRKKVTMCPSCKSLDWDTAKEMTEC